MRLELRYENSCPTYQGDGEEPAWYFPEGQFDTYQELLKFTDKHWNWRAFCNLYIEFADNDRPTKEDRQALKTLNETFREDLAKIEAKEKALEEIEKKRLVCRLRAFKNSPDKACGTYNNYFLLMRDVEENYGYGVYDGLYVAFPDDYHPEDWEVKALEDLNKKFIEDKEQATKF